MEIISKAKFFDITKQFEFVPYSQTYGWFCFHNCDENGRCVFFIDDVNNPQIACFAHTKKAFGLEMLLVEGECFRKKEYTNSMITAFYKEIGQLPYDMIEINSNSAFNFEFEIGIRRAGFLRPVGLFSIPLTIIVPLSEPIEYDRNWKRNLKKGEQNQFSFEYIVKPTTETIKLFVETYNKLSDYKGFGTKLKEANLFKLLQEPTMNLFVIKNAEGKPLCLRIIYMRDQEATDVFAANTLESRELSATHAMMDKLFNYLKERGINNFDFARILAGHSTGDSVFLFKNGVRGQKLLYNGEWSKYKKKIYRPMMYFVKKFLFHRTEI